MELICKKAYDFSREYIGTKEVAGPGNNAMIVLAHHLCGISSINPTTDVDSSVPWCSSWVNLAILCANMRINPAKTCDLLRAKGFKGYIISQVAYYAKVEIAFLHIDTKLPIKEPTWSANSRSWDSWGEAIPVEQAQRGDLVRLVRDGGGHIAFLDEDKAGKLFLNILGGNQHNEVCSADWYSRTRLVHVRRA